MAMEVTRPDGRTSTRRPDFDLKHGDPPLEGRNLLRRERCPTLATQALIDHEAQGLAVNVGNSLDGNRILAAALVLVVGAGMATTKPCRDDKGKFIRGVQNCNAMP